MLKYWYIYAFVVGGVGCYQVGMFISSAIKEKKEASGNDVVHKRKTTSTFVWFAVSYAIYMVGLLTLITKVGD